MFQPGLYIWVLEVDLFNFCAFLPFSTYDIFTFLLLLFHFHSFSVFHFGFHIWVLGVDLSNFCVLSLLNTQDVFTLFFRIFIFIPFQFHPGFHVWVLGFICLTFVFFCYSILRMSSLLLFRISIFICFQCFILVFMSEFFGFICLTSVFFCYSILIKSSLLFFYSEKIQSFTSVSFIHTWVLGIDISSFLILLLLSTQAVFPLLPLLPWKIHSFSRASSRLFHLSQRWFICFSCPLVSLYTGGLCSCCSPWKQTFVSSTSSWPSYLS